MTTAIPAIRKPSPWPSRITWVLKALVAIAFLMAAFQKVTSQPMMVKDFQEIGFGQGFRFLTAAIESVGAVLLLWPRGALAGVVILTGICAGALAAQLGPLRGDVIHVFVLGALVLTIGALDWRASRRAAS